jgi:antirestriction protein ArdC
VRARSGAPGADPDDEDAKVATSKMKATTMRKTEAKPRADIYARITDRIAADLGKGVRPWVQPWSAGNLAGEVSRPLRHNGEPYSGMNVLLLWSEAIARGFQSSTWMTFKQALELGGAVRKGETGSMVVFASRFTRTDADTAGDEATREIPFLKAYTVFNVAQIGGLPDRFYADSMPIRERHERIAEADAFFANTGAVIRHGGSKAYYAPASDHVQMPPFATFRDAASHVAVLSHELTHWTAAPSRLNRDLSRYAKDKSERAREELIAELGSCFLCADLGIAPELEPRDDHASYIGSWLKVLADDKRAIFQAAAHAQKAVAFLHGLQPPIAEPRQAA